MNDTPKDPTSANLAYKHALEREKSGEVSRGQMLAIWKEVAQNALIELGATQERSKASVATARSLAGLAPMIEGILSDAAKVRDAHMRAVKKLSDLARSVSLPDGPREDAAHVVQTHSIDAIKILGSIDADAFRLENELIELSRLIGGKLDGAPSPPCAL